MTAHRPANEVLAAAAAAAGAAPSIHNTQPWRWQVYPDQLELHAERDRQLAVSDPDGRMMTISCGAALHHAQVALAAQGNLAAVARLPDPANPDLLARLTLAGRAPVTLDATHLYQNIQQRRTDRRPVTRKRVPSSAVDILLRAATDCGVQLQVLHPFQVDDLAAAVSHAAAVDAADPDIQAELDRWTGEQCAFGTGIPASAIPARTPQTNVPARNFARSGTLPIGDEHDRAASYALLYGDADEPAGWLAAGEALSALWLAAVGLGVGVLPISEAVEMPATRQTLRRTLSFFGWPYLAMRLGIPDPDHPGPERTPRLPTEETVKLM